MKLSIIIPAYNAAKYIERCVESIVSQNYSDIEILLIDDGSTDETLAICQGLSCKHSNIIVLHKNNEGVSSARNYGIDNACGEYLMFVDADDYLLPGTLAQAIGVVNSYAEADFYVYGFDRISRNGKAESVSSSPRVYLENNKLDFIMNSHSVMLGAPWAKIFSREFIAKRKLYFDKNTRLFEDICFNMKAIENSNMFITSDLRIYCYEMNSSSATARFNGDKFIEDILNYYNTVVRTVGCIKSKCGAEESETEESKAEALINEARRTVCFDTLYEIYNVYRSKSLTNRNRYNWTKHLVRFMQSFDPQWKSYFKTSFPLIFKLSYGMHPVCAYFVLKTVFLFKR